MTLGKVIKRTNVEVEIEDRLIMVSLLTFDTGIQRVRASLADCSPLQMRVINKELRKKVILLEEKLKEKETDETNK